MEKQAFKERVDRFWQRVTEGMQLSQLWAQFRKDAHSSYRLYSQEVDATRVAGVPHSKHVFSVARQFFWAILEKLTPARRVLLLIALVLIIVPGGEWSWTAGSGQVKVFALDFHFYGGLLMFALLILEVADRVVVLRHGRKVLDLGCGPGGHETRPADCAGNPDMAPARRAATDSRPLRRLCYAACQYRCRRLLRCFCPAAA